MWEEGGGKGWVFGCGTEADSEGWTGDTERDEAVHSWPRTSPVDVDTGHTGNNGLTVAKVDARCTGALVANVQLDPQIRSHQFISNSK